MSPTREIYFLFSIDDWILLNGLKKLFRPGAILLKATGLVILEEWGG